MPPNPVDLTSFTPEQKKLFAQAASLGTGVQTIDYNAPGATLNNAISATSLQNGVQPYQIGTTTQTYTPPANPLQASLAAATQGAQTTYDKNVADLESAFARLDTASAREGELEDKYGVTAVDQRLNELFTIDAGYAADLSHIASQNLQGTVAQQGTATGELGRRINLKDLNYNTVIAEQNTNIKRATNNVAIAAAQGQLANAQKQVDRALELEFGPVRNRIELLKNFLSINANTLSDARKNELTNKIATEERAYQEGLANKQGVLEILKTAAQSGASPSVLQQLQSATTPEQAMQIAAAAGVFIPKNTFTIGSDANGNQVQYELDSQGRVVGSKVLSTKAPTDTSPPEVSTQQQLQNIEALTLAKELRADDALGKGSALGFSLAKFVPFGQSLGLQGSRTAFEAKVDTLKANLTLENLALLKGAMSDKDLLFLNAIGSSLNTNMSEAAFNAELDRIIAKLETAGGSGSTAQEGQTKVWEGVTYVVRNGTWVPQ